MFKWFIKGSLVGIANIIPGVSGGTIAVILNIYDPIIEAMSNMVKNWKKLKQQVKFLCSISLGATIGIIGFSKAIEFLFNTYQDPTNAFILGLLLGGIPILYKTQKNMGPSLSKIILFCLGCVSMGLFIYLMPDTSSLILESPLATVRSQSTPYLLIIISCAIAAGAMIIPGISGSQILLILGVYPFVLHSINTFNWHNLGVITLSSLVGVILISQFMRALLKNYSAHTYYCIIGIILTSSYMFLPHFTGWNLALAAQIICIPFGYILAQKLN